MILVPRGGVTDGCALAHESTKAMRKLGRVEVYEKPDIETRESEVSQELCFVNWEKSGNGFQLEQDAPIDDNVHEVRTVEPNRLVDDGERSLSFERQAKRPQLET